MLSENFSTYMTKNVEITLVGSATELMSIERRSSMNTRMTRIAIAPPNTIETSTSRVFSRMKRACSMMRSARIPLGNVFSMSASFALTSSLTAMVFVPDCLTTSKVTAASPLTRMRVRSSSWPSSTRPTSERRTLEPSAAVATMRLRISSTLFNSPTVRTLISRVPSS